MERRKFFFRIFLSFFLMAVLLLHVKAQGDGCILKDPIVQIDFGKGSNVEDFNANKIPNYERISGGCPTDGHYTFTSYTSNCFEGDWFTLTEDHTPGDREGNMMMVNAFPGGGVFFSRPIKGLQAKSRYELAIWVINVCKLHICCSSLSPDISLILTTTSGKWIAGFGLGELSQKTVPQWRKYVSYFTMPAGETALVLTMRDNSIGGCGNDFAMDDITFRECIPQKSVVKTEPKKVTPPVAKKADVPKPEAKKEPVKTTVSKTPVRKTEKEPIVSLPPVPKQKTAITVPAPKVLITRANPLIKQIETEPGELIINLYDNGEIDGDTVSVYHNNELIVSKARLTQKPISFRIKVDPAKAYHELIMVAENLGTIPPNTSLMTVNVNDKRYQVFISSSEQKNAKVVIVLKE